MDKVPRHEGQRAAAESGRYAAIFGAVGMRYASLNTIVGLIASLLVAACVASTNRAAAADSQVLFVCEHGNVKSLMAASYFNQIASERGLPFRAVSRGTAPDSTTVPPVIVTGLRDDGVDVAAFHPVAVGAADVSASRRVILINTVLPTSAQVTGVESEQWNDVPPATADYAAARAALKRHIGRLIGDLENSVRN